MLEVQNVAEYGRTKKQFGQAAEAYTASAIFSDGEDLRWLVEAAAPRSDEDALDVGTAAGYTAFALAPLVRRVVGIDVTPAMVEAARRNAGQSGLANFTAEVANAEELPFPDGSFDIVACRYTAHHFRRPKVAVGEMARTLRPGGRLVVVDNTAPENGELDQWINHVERLRDPSHVKEWSVGEWQGAPVLEQHHAGFGYALGHGDVGHRAGRSSHVHGARLSDQAEAKHLLQHRAHGSVEGGHVELVTLHHGDEGAGAEWLDQAESAEKSSSHAGHRSQVGAHESPEAPRAQCGEETRIRAGVDAVERAVRAHE